MAIKRYKPTTPTRRHTQLEDRRSLSKVAPYKKLTFGKRATGARNMYGHITVRHKGGGVKRKLRMIDHKKEKFNVPGIVETIEFDPNISANIALIKYADGERRYVLASKGMTVGMSVLSGESVEPNMGNTMKLKNVPSGTFVYDVELLPGKGGKLGRSAGTGIVMQGMDSTGKYAQLKMPSGEVRLVNAECFATIGLVGNEDHMNVKLGKAGRKIHMGIRPAVRGVAMHAEQHPHGGGEGRGGPTAHKDIWGNRVGTRTRKNQRTGKFIIKPRVSARRPNRKIER